VEELEDEADARSPEAGGRGLAKAVDARPVDGELAVGGSIEAADEVEQRGLAASRRSHDGGDPTRLDRQVDPIERGLGRAVVAFRDLVERDDGVHLGPP
jgi:hypothetical protein